MSIARLRDALAAARRNDDAAASLALIAAWRARRAPALAALVELIETRSPDELTARLAHVITPRVATSHARFAQLAEIDDPRLARFVLDALASPPFTAVTAEPLLIALVAAIDRLADPRLGERMPAIRAAIGARITRAPLRDELLRRLEVAAAEQTRPRKASAEELQLEAALAVHYEPLRGATRTAEALLADIYANPFDDGPRLVYADMLSQRDDPHGELIALQLARGRDGEPTPRERELLKKHGKAWLGPLASALSFGKGYSGTRFVRGFVAIADFIFNVDKKVAAIIDEPAWATVERLEGPWPFELAERAPLRALRSFDRFPDEQALAALARRASPLGSVLDLHIDPTFDVELIHRAFPGVTTIRFYGERTSVATVAALGRFRVPHVVIECPWTTATEATEAEAAHAALVAGLVGTPASVEQLSIAPPFYKHPKPVYVTLWRGADGMFVIDK